MLKIGAMKRGLPKDLADKWDIDLTKEDLIDQYKRHLDFCMEAKWPNKNMMLELFGEEFLKEHHVYVGVEDIDAGSYSDMTIVQDGSCGEFHFGRYDAINMWVLGDSEVYVSGSGSAYVFVHACDNSHVTMEQSGSARVIVKKHGKNATVLTTGDVKYIEEE